MFFDWYHNRKISKLTESAKVYVNTNYKELPKSPVETTSDIKFSKKDSSNGRIDNNSQNTSNIRYSTKTDSDLNSEGKGEIKFSKRDSCDSTSNNSDIKYSVRRDNYDSDTIDSTLRRLYASDSPLDTLKFLENNTNMSFVDKMLDYINIKHMRDSDVYKAAQVDRRLFSKIVTDRTYKPSKDTCIALAFALKLSLYETNDILSRAGYTLSHSSKRDVVIEYFFREHIYNLNEINEILFRLDQKLLGR